MVSESELVVDVVLVARNCARALELTLDRLPWRLVRSVVLVDNGSTDATGQIGRDRGAVLLRSRGGYGAACRLALQHLERLPRAPDVVVLLNPLGPEDPACLGALLDLFRTEHAEMVLAVPPEGVKAVGLGDRALLRLMSVLYGQRVTGFDSLCAIRFAALVALGLADKGDGWNTELVVKAVRLGLHIAEVPVRYLDKPTNLDGAGRSRLGGGRKLFRILRHATAR